MLVELGLAVLLTVGLVEPRPALDWLTGQGAWFATMYQVMGLAWLAALLALAVSVTTGWGRVRSVIGTVVVAVVYGLPVALFIR